MGRDRWSAESFAVLGSTEDRGADDDVAEVEGPGDGRDDRRDRDRGAFVGAGEVGGALRVVGGGAGSGGGLNDADAGVKRTGGGGLLGFAAL